MRAWSFFLRFCNTAWLVLGITIALFITRYIAWINGFRLMPWLAYLAMLIALVVAILWLLKHPFLRVIVAVGAIYGGWKLAWIDEILAKEDFAVLCQREAGVHIYKRITLPLEYFDEKRGFTFINEARGDVDNDRLPPGFSFQFEPHSLLERRYTKLYRTREAVSYGIPPKIIAEQVVFSAKGGGPPRPIEGPELANSPCPKKMLSASDFMKKVFVFESSGERQ